MENLASCVSSSSSHSHSQSLPTRRQEAQSSSFSHSVSRSVVRHGSESDRPDSGFDSNKDEREEEGEVEPERVFAEDWWNHTRAAVELHGNFRIRPTIYHNFSSKKLLTV